MYNSGNIMPVEGVEHLWKNMNMNGSSKQDRLY